MASSSRKSDRFINILLLGETGVGKSTFINSIVNYLTYGSFKQAQRGELIVLIPTKYLVTDKYNKHHIVHVESKEDDGNECLQDGQSATQNVKAYIFPIRNGSLYLRLIDTPGMGDGRGIDQDNVTCEKILDYIGQLEELHAICYLFKPTNPRITVTFQYCMAQILSRLDKSASKNLVFIFTNTGSTNYGPGDTLISLRRVIDDINARPPYADTPLNENMFCLDNEAFRYLAAVRQNVKFDLNMRHRIYLSWKRSAEKCTSLINYILGDRKNPPLEPHLMQSTTAVNEARRLIVQLSQPLAEIFELLNDNLMALEQHKESLNVHSDSLQELKTKLYMPIVELQVETLLGPVTVCADIKCAEIYKVGDVNKWHYKQRCHDPCYLRTVPKEIMGSPELLDCESIDWQTKKCIECGCDVSRHMHVYYLTRTVEKQTVDNNIRENIVEKEEVLDEVTKLLVEISSKMDELEEEHETIIKTCAKFAHFLQNNAITPFCDYYNDYIEHLIRREQSLGSQSNETVISQLQKLLVSYEAAKEFFIEASLPENDSGDSDTKITPQKIQESIQALYRLKYSGSKIKELFRCQDELRRTEYKHSEYVHEFTSETDYNQSMNADELGTEIAELDNLNIDGECSSTQLLVTEEQDSLSLNPGNSN